jgi:hypothetical protein
LAPRLFAALAEAMIDAALAWACTWAGWREGADLAALGRAQKFGAIRRLARGTAAAAHCHPKRECR